MKVKKLMVVGHARHGKDTVSEYLRDYYGVPFVSSSAFLAEKVVYPVLKDRYGYKTLDECYQDRGNHRKEWFDLLVEYNTPDLARLGTELYERNDMYCGLRNRNELMALKAKGVIDLILFVDASERLPLESTDSMTITKQDADVIIDNNGTLEQLYDHLDVLFKALGYTRSR